LFAVARLHGDELRILDDSPTDMELTTIALEATGREISVRSATDGKSALAMLRKGAWGAGSNIA
jgi:CheY-like chemotaxis protein